MLKFYLALLKYHDYIHYDWVVLNITHASPSRTSFFGTQLLSLAVVQMVGITKLFISLLFGRSLLLLLSMTLFCTLVSLIDVWQSGIFCRIVCSMLVWFVIPFWWLLESSPRFSAGFWQKLTSAASVLSPLVAHSAASNFLAASSGYIFWKQSSHIRTGW